MSKFKSRACTLLLINSFLFNLKKKYETQFKIRQKLDKDYFT